MTVGNMNLGCRFLYSLSLLQKQRNIPPPKKHKILLFVDITCILISPRLTLGKNADDSAPHWRPRTPWKAALPILAFDPLSCVCHGPLYARAAVCAHHLGFGGRSAEHLGRCHPAKR